MDKKIKFMFRAAVITAALSAIAFVIIGSTAPVEAGMSMFGQWLKTFFMWAFVTVILETFTYTIAQVAYHWKDDYKEKYGNKWFTEGIKEDFRYLKEKVTWKKVLKTIGIYILFFAVCLAAFAAIELLVP
jgi:hypothetical protein